VVFCDGDFWHGRNWETRKKRLEAGSNPRYWVKKIERNMERDQENTWRLVRDGWSVIRLWESDILSDTKAAAELVIAELNRILSDT